MRKFKTDILIRDNRLEQMQNMGIKVNHEILSDENYIVELKRKLIEESTEAMQENDIEELKHEIADVLEVVDHLIEACGFDREELSKIKKEKQEKIGGFKRRIKTSSVEMEEDNEGSLNYYTTRPHKYPEILG